MTFLFKIASGRTLFYVELFIAKEAALNFILFFILFLILIVYGAWILAWTLKKWKRIIENKEKKEKERR